VAADSHDCGADQQGDTWSDKSQRRRAQTLVGCGGQGVADVEMSGCVTAANREIKRDQHALMTPDCFNGIRIMWRLDAT
jgi:hypothetical protein